MPSWLKELLPMLTSLGGFLKDLLLGLFIFNKGIDKEVLKQKEKEVKDAKKAHKLKNHIKSLPDDVARDSLRNSRKSKPKD